MELLMGLNASDWFKLFRKNMFGISPGRWPAILKLTLLTLRNSSLMKKEIAQYGQQIEQTEIKKPPLFILGHWRSGTTLLHRLMSLDPQFAYPNMFEVYNPWSFLTMEPILEKRLENLPAKKRPMDNMVMTYKDPAEDEFAISLLSSHSPIMGWAFPKHEQYFDRYLTLHNLSEAERQEWKRVFVYFLKKLTLKYQKPLLLKSPHHTARVKTLLELFPDAKFIHIHRNPYHIFRSTVNLYKNTVANLSLSRRNPERDIEGIINRYRVMYDFYLEERKAIPPNHLIDIAFEDLEKDFEQEIGKIYKTLNLSSWDAYQPLLEAYLKKQSEYKKNEYPPIEKRWREKINRQWERTFKEWGYPIED